MSRACKLPRQGLGRWGGGTGPMWGQGGGVGIVTGGVIIRTIANYHHHSVGNVGSSGARVINHHHFARVATVRRHSLAHRRTMSPRNNTHHHDHGYLTNVGVCSHRLLVRHISNGGGECGVW